MNLRRLSLAAVVLLLFTLTASLFAADRAAEWKSVSDAQQAGQPKTASATLDGIITAALADNSYAEALKAILQKTQTEVAPENWTGWKINNKRNPTCQKNAEHSVPSLRRK